MTDPLEGLDPDTDPLGTLVAVWRLCGEHSALQPGLNRRRCEAQATSLRRRLGSGTAVPYPVVHPAAALRALDEYCAALGSAAPGPRRVGEHWVVTRPEGWTSRVAENQPGHLGYWMRKHQVIPAEHRGIRIDLASARRDALAELARPFLAGTGGFEDGVRPAWTTPTPPFTADVLDDPERRWTSVKSRLDEAAAARTRVVVLPELAVDAAVRERVVQWLQDEDHWLLLVVAGSFHEDVAGKRRNVGRLLSGDGEELLGHEKLQPMRCTVTEAGQQVDFDEAIEGASEIRALTSPVGVLAMAVCLDFCEALPAPIAEVWSRLGPGLALVPSMGGEETIRRHDRQARELRRSDGTRTLVASQHHEGNSAVGIAWHGAPDPARAPGWLWLTVD